MARTEALSPDTALEAGRVQFSIWRKIGFAGRAQMTVRLCDALRATVEAGVRHRHPEYTDDQVRLAAVRLALGDSLFRLAFPGVEVTG